MADVAAEMDALPLCFQQLRDDGRRRGLAVAAGNSNDFARAEREEQLCRWPLRLQDADRTA